MPAFGPPTWSIIVLYGLGTHMPTVAIILTGALAAALGRFALAHAFRLLGRRVPQRIRGNLAAAREALERNKRGGLLALGLFALSPLPSAQLFEAAGLARVRLAAFTAAFFGGRLVSYSIYAFTAKGMQKTSMGEEFLKSFTSPASIAIQLLMIAALFALIRVDWRKRLGGNGAETTAASKR
ncbi:MAG: hypothetical protein B7Y45_03135 [Sphingomonas sp. 28-66-16]|nr:MAG: hypothetical protein B7Y45_03135 [Sphingomonas sp. 28-66-16]